MKKDWVMGKSCLSRLRFSVTHLFCVIVVSLVMCAPLSASGANENEQDNADSNLHQSSDISSDKKPAIDQYDEFYVDSAGNLQLKVPGVGSSFGKTLDKMVAFTSTSQNPFNDFATHLPLLFPDLYKVLVTL